MGNFSIREAAFSGFDLARRQPLTVLSWFLFSIVANVASFALAFGLIGSKAAQFEALSKQDQTDPTAALSAIGSMLGAFALLLPIYMLIGAVTTTAANRAILRPAERRFGYLRLGGDELRMFVTLFVLGLVLMGVYIASLVAGGVVLGVVGVTAAAAKGSAGGVAGAVVGSILMIVLVLGAFGFLGARLALAPAQTLDTGKINIFGSWTLTKGRTGKVFLTYLVAVLLYLALYIVSFAVMGAISMGLGAGFLGAVQGANPASGATFATLLAPATIIYLIVMAFVAAVGMAVMLCPGASIYKQITGQGLADVF